MDARIGCGGIDSDGINLNSKIKQSGLHFQIMSATLMVRDKLLSPQTQFIRI
jgi:hypothetical protein